MGKKLSPTEKRLEPQEIDILSSIHAHACVTFNFSYAWHGAYNGSTQKVSPLQPWYGDVSAWCNKSLNITFENNQVPRQLPHEFF